MYSISILLILQQLEQPCLLLEKKTHTQSTVSLRVMSFAFYASMMLMVSGESHAPFRPTDHRRRGRYWVGDLRAISS
jgi:hypothetical protein